MPLIRRIKSFHFYAFQSISSRLRHTYFFKFLRGSNCSKRKKVCVKGNNYAAPDCDSSDSDLVIIHFNHKHKVIFVLIAGQPTNLTIQFQFHMETIHFLTTCNSLIKTAHDRKWMSYPDRHLTVTSPVSCHVITAPSRDTQTVT